MIAMEEKKCSVHLRIYLGSEKERQYGKADVFPSSATSEVVGTKIRWSLVFMFNKSKVLTFEAFVKSGTALLELSQLSLIQMQQWWREGELVKITDVKLSRKEVFAAFEKISPQSEQAQPAGMCNRWVITLLKELNICLPDGVENMAKKFFQKANLKVLKNHVKDVHSLFGGLQVKNGLQNYSVNGGEAEKGGNENKKRTPALEKSDLDARSTKRACSRITSMDEEKCSVYLHIYLESERDGVCDKGGFHSSSISEEVGTEIRWSLVFVFSESWGLMIKGFQKNGGVSLGLSSVSPSQMELRSQKEELVKIDEVKLSGENVFTAFEMTTQEIQATRPAGEQNSWVINFLEKLDVHLPDGADHIPKKFFKSGTPSDIEEYTKAMRSLLKGKGSNDSLQYPAVDKACAENSSNEKKETTPAPQESDPDLQSTMWAGSKVKSTNKDKCTVSIRIYPASDRERRCGKDDPLPSSVKAEEVKTDLCSSLVFMFNKSGVLMCEAFLEIESVSLGLSYVSPSEIEQGSNNELVTVDDAEVSSDAIFKAFEKTAQNPQFNASAVKRKPKDWVITFLKELDITLPLDVERKGTGTVKARSPSNPEERVKEPRSLSAENASNGCDREPSPDKGGAEDNGTEEKCDDLRFLLGATCLNDRLQGGSVDRGRAGKTINNDIELRYNVRKDATLGTAVEVDLETGVMGYYGIYGPGYRI